MRFSLFSRPVEAPKAPDMTIYHYEFLARLFGLEEAKKNLLNVVSPVSITPEMVLSDSAALEMTVGGKGWGVFEKAVWLKLLTSLRLSLAGKTIEERESARSRVLAHLEVLHLPYEMRFAADNIKKMRELEKAVKETSNFAGQR